MKAIFYIPETGKITKCIEAINYIIEANKAEGEEYIEGEVDNVDNYKVVNGAVVHKQELPVVLNGTTISNIPVNTYVQINLQPVFIVDDGVLELEATYNQVVLVYLHNADYIPKTIQVSV